MNARVLQGRWGHILGLSFLALQLGAIGYARFIPERFFCWAPYDQHSWYRVEVVVDGQYLTEAEIRARYRYGPRRWEQRSIHNVFSLIRQYESTYGKEDYARVTVTYETNGKPEAIWHWPE